MIESIEPFHTLGMVLKEDHLDRVVIELPLSGNRNDKGTTFAGSSYAAMVLAGWRLACNWKDDHGLTAPVVSKSVTVEYPKPGMSNLLCTARLANNPDKRASGNWRLLILVEARDQNDDLCANIKCDYRITNK